MFSASRGHTNQLSFDEFVFVVVIGQVEQFFGGHEGLLGWNGHRHLLIATSEKGQASAARLTLTRTAQYLNSGIFP